MIDAGGDVGVDTGVEVGQHERFEGHVKLFNLAILFELSILLLENFVKLLRVSLFPIDFVSPQVSDSLAKLIILSVRKEAQHLLSMSLNCKQVMVT